MAGRFAKFLSALLAVLALPAFAQFPTIPNGTLIGNFTGSTGPAQVSYFQAGVTIVANDVNPSNSAATNTTNMAAHISTCVSGGGGCIIQLGCFSSPIPFANSSSPGIVLGTSVAVGNAGQDTPYNGIHIKGCGYTVNTNGVGVSGTVLQGNSQNYPLIAYNYVDNTVNYTNAATMYASLLLSFSLEDVAIDNASYGIKIGALSKAGASEILLRNVVVTDYTQWGIWLENAEGGHVQDLFANYGGSTAPVGAMMFVGSGGNLNNFGNIYFLNLSGAPATSGNPRGIVFEARTSAGGSVSYYNQLDVYTIGISLPNIAVSQAATMSNGSANIGVTDVSKFPINSAVTFDNYVNGFLKWYTYFVTTNPGGSGAGNIQVSLMQGGTPVTANGNTAVNIKTWGNPPVEIVGEGQNGTNGVQSVTMTGRDMESGGTTMLLIQNAAADVTIDVSNGSGAQGTSFSSSIAGRYSSGFVRSKPAMVLDYDAVSAVNIFTLGSIDTTSGQPIVQTGGYFGFGYNPTVGLGAFSLGGQNNLYGAAQMFSMNAAPFQNSLIPQVGMGQRTVYDTSGTTSYNGEAVGNVIFKGSGAATKTLPQLSNSGVPYGAGGANATSPGSTTSGIPFEIFNDTAYVETIAANTTNPDYFNDNSTYTSVTCPPGAGLSLRAVFNGSNSFWQTLDMLGCVFGVPSIASGFGSSPSVTHYWGTGAGMSLSVNVGTGGSATSGVITMPKSPAGNGWACSVADVTHTDNSYQTGSSATSVTVTGSAAWTGSDILQMNCAPN